MRTGTLLAVREDGARLIYEGADDLYGIRKVHMGRIVSDEGDSARHPVLSIITHGGWRLKVSNTQWDALLNDTGEKSVTGDLLKAGRNVIGDALAALDNMPDIEPGYLAAPWPVMGKLGLKDEVWEDSTIKAVDIESLYATQELISRERVEYYVKNPGAIEEGRRAFANVYAKQVGDTPRNVIVDGHHRLAALWLLGADIANVWFLEEGA